MITIRQSAKAYDRNGSRRDFLFQNVNIKDVQRFSSFKDAIKLEQSTERSIASPFKCDISLQTHPFWHDPFDVHYFGHFYFRNHGRSGIGLYAADICSLNR